MFESHQQILMDLRGWLRAVLQAALTDRYLSLAAKLAAAIVAVLLPLLATIALRAIVACCDCRCAHFCWLRILASHFVRAIG